VKFSSVVASELGARVHWKALLRGRLVADCELDNPSVRFDLRQFSQEARDETPIKERGWQDAVKAIYPLRINRFVIRNGNVTYIDKGPFRPLQITELNFLAELAIARIEFIHFHFQGWLIAIFSRGRAKRFL
jgi:hypothetical protein